MRKIIFLAVLAVYATFFFTACQRDTEMLHQQKQNTVGGDNTKNFSAAKQSKKVYVSTVNMLYEAVNNTENAGSTIILAPGTYMLNATYPKAGRLELLNNMSISGQPGQPDLVVIDASELPLTSFTVAGTTSRTGAIRMGDGSNAIEWITFQNDPTHTIRSLIQTDIITTPTAQIRVAHCIIKGSSIGLSIINRDAAANSRALEADISDNEIMNNTVPQFGSGIQIQNTNVSNAQIKVKLARNHINNNKSGMLIFNSSSQNCQLDIQSNNDKIENNGIGMVLNAGFILSAANQTLDNKLMFEAFATTIRNNTGIPAPPFSFPAGGAHAAAGQSMAQFFGPAGTAHYNQLSVSFYGCDLSGNAGNSQISVYGGHAFLPSVTPVGTFNTANLYLHGTSAAATVNAIASFPAEPEGTNIVSVYR